MFHNRFIHLSTSAILPFLPRTNFTLCDLHTLLYEYRLAPMAGEIDLGGVQGVMERSPTSFASLTVNSMKIEILFLPMDDKDFL
ncbi:MAG: hypothetical protein AB7F64_09715 [Gammaproteobacteria bacterium]